MIRKFIGQDGSLGLKRNNYYDVYTMKYGRDIKVTAWIYSENGELIVCPYTSVKTFNQNWR